MKTKTITFHKAWFTKREEKALGNTLRSGWIAKGPQTEEFEKQFASFIGTKYAIGLNSCTAGLHLSLIALGLRPGDEVITSPLTFTATASTIIHSGATPRFTDVEYSSGTLDPACLKKQTGKRTKAVVVVHLAGYPSRLDEITSYSKKKNIVVIEDAAHALGAQHKGKNIGAWGKTAAFSFYATKNITTGEGGMLTTNDKRLAQKIKILSLHGITKDAWKRATPQTQTHYQVVAAGFKYNMFDLQAALGIEQLSKISRFVKKREQVWKWYDNELRDVPGIELPHQPVDGVHAKHLYTVKINLDEIRVSRDDVLKRMAQKNIQCQVHFISLHLQPYYKKMFGFKPKDFPVALQLSQSMLSLPFYPQLTEEDVVYVCSSLRDIMHNVKKKSTY